MRVFVFLSSYTWRRQTNVQKPYICTRFVHNFSYMMNIKNFKRRQNLLHLVIIVTIYFCFWFSYSFDLIRLRFMTDASWFVDWGFSFYYVWTIGGSQSTWLLFVWKESCLIIIIVIQNKTNTETFCSSNVTFRVLIIRYEWKLLIYLWNWYTIEMENSEKHSYFQSNLILLFVICIVSA